MKKYILIIAFALCATTAFAQMTKENDYGINHMKIEYRGDFDCFSQDEQLSSGFTGKFFNFYMDGELTPKLYYVFRQRINKIQKEYNFFDATDFLYFGWRITDRIAWTMGKEIVWMGGIEYDLAPIDVYFHSHFWDQFNCYRFGTNLEFTSKNGKNLYTFQVTNSPFDNSIKFSGLYNYSIHWRGTYEHFMTSCSVNMFEYNKGCFLNVIALGTTFEFGPVEGYIDFANRAHGDQYQFFFKDMTAIIRCGYNIKDKMMQLFVKAGYDVNDAQYADTPMSQVYDPCVLPGTDIVFYGGGFEFYPWKGKKDIRVHGFFAVSDVRRSMEYTSEGVLGVDDIDCTSYQANIGVTWRLKFIDK